MASTRLNWIVLTTGGALVGAVLAGAVLAQGGLGQEPDVQPRAFQVYDSPAVRERVQSADKHIEGERWSEALVDLQALLEDHRGQVLGASYPPLPSGRDRSLHPVHGGASEWATRTLAGLPDEAKALYQNRHGAQAKRALEAALATADRAGLARVARRFPLTREAGRAWWALGDLEIERGDVEVGLAAWARGLSGLLGDLDLDPTKVRDWSAARLRLIEEPDLSAATGASARVEVALARLGGEGELAALAVEGQVGSALERGGDLGRLGRNPDTWPRHFDLPHGAENPFTDPRGQHALFPTRDGDTLYVSTSRAVLAVGAYTGELVWRSAENLLGWHDVHPLRIDSFKDGIAFDDSMIRPAADRGTVVAALQVPYAFEAEDSYGDLEIIQVIPERRLFAFDAETGALLWDTRPPADWDGETGGFAERTTVVGSPVIEGSRVLVPMARLRGRIELFVGCFDLFTGELSWSTPVLTGQRPLNMFGRLVAEYVSPPLVVAGDRLVVQTQLGTVACLDLFTGETLWHAIYDHIVFTKGSYRAPGQLRSHWRNAPPAVVGPTVIAAPLDSREILGLDLATGAVLWTLPHTDVTAYARAGSASRPVNVLLGADEQRIYLGGRRVVALESPGGLASEAPRRRAWAYPSEVTDFVFTGAPRPVIGEDRIYVPRDDFMAVLDRRSGKQVDRVAWGPSDEGNLLISEGTLFTLSGYDLTGFFEWDAMVRRARAELAKSPDDPRRIGDLALLLYKRGLSSLAAGDYRRARQHLEDARDELDRHPADHPSLRTIRHRVLRAEGKNLRLAADPREALNRLRAARPLAPDRQARLDTLLEEQAVLRDRDFDAWLAILALIEQESAREAIPFLVQREGGDTIAWRGPIMPEVASLSEPGPGLEPLRLPIGLWVLVERSLGYERRKKIGDLGLALADLHQILRHYPGYTLPGGLAAWDWSAGRVAAALADGVPAEYQTFEDQAQALLSLARRESNLGLLERIPRLYPHSHAAAQSNDAQIEIAIAAGDAQRVAEIVLDELDPDFWSPRSASERQVRNLALLAHLLGERGNLELRATLSRRLADHHPQVLVDLPGTSGVQVEDLARVWALPERDPAPVPTFGAQLATVQSTSTLSPFMPVGVVPPGPGQEGVVQLMCDGARLLAFADGAASRKPDEQDAPLWSYGFNDRPNSFLAGESLPTDFENAIVTSPGRVHVASLKRVLTFERESDTVLWTWSAGAGSLVSLQQSDGVVVAREELGLFRDRSVARLTGIDAASGVELWSFPLLDRDYAPTPVLGEGRMVLLPRSARPALIFDLFTGRAGATFELDLITTTTRRASWIEHGRIVLPFFMREQREEQNHVVAYDLNTGRRDWRVPFSGGRDGPRELVEMLSYRGRHFLNLAPVSGAGGPKRKSGLYELDTNLGALATRPVAELPDDSGSIGIARHQHTWLQGPYLFLLCMPQQGGEKRYTVRAIHLRYGERWRAPLPAEFARTPASDLPLPAVSEGTIVLAYALPIRGSRSKRAQLMMVDRASGRPLEVHDLPEYEGRKFTLSPFGAALLVSRSGKLDLMR